MIVSPFELTDVADLPLERLPLRTHEYYEPHYVRAIASHGPAYTARVDGKVMLIAGVAYDDERIGWLWSFLALDSGPHMLALTRGVMRAIAIMPGPLRATADKMFEPSCRWLSMLGFTLCDDPAWPPGPDFLFELK